MATVRVRSPVRLPPWETPTVTRRLGMPGGCAQGHAEECGLPFLTKDPGSLFTGIE